MHVNAAKMLATHVIFSGCAVLLGAFAAHGLKDVLSETAIGIFQTGVRYMMWHAIGGICYVLWVKIHAHNTLWPSWCFAVGTVLFSGSLFAIALTSISWIGAITPLGGLCFIAGWVGFLLTILKQGPCSLQPSDK
ncbi:MAG: DUF423 domain-containing protein [Candidatus Margulisbacteria bacterium]|nr:DUF423 domain-containing protein [Candidatus Margulisiibacteriota bacterium]